MLEFLLRIIKEWWQSRLDGGVLESENFESIHQEQEKPRQPHQGFRFENLQDQLDTNEFLENEQARTEQGFDIKGIGDHNLTKRHVRRLTAFGVEEEAWETLLQNPSGQIVKPEQLHGGGICQSCTDPHSSIWDSDNYFKCSVCSKGVGRCHVLFLDNLPFCPDDAIHYSQERNTWL